MSRILFANRQGVDIIAFFHDFIIMLDPIYYEAIRDASPELYDYTNRLLTTTVKLHKKIKETPITSREYYPLIKDICEKNFPLFNGVVHGNTFDKLGIKMIRRRADGSLIWSLHGALSVIAQWGIQTHRHIAIIVGRDHGKTLIFSTCLCDWLAAAPKLLRAPEFSYITATGDVAAEKGQYIRNDLTRNPTFLTLWGDLKKNATRWNEDRIECGNGFILNFDGVGYQHRGPHPAGGCVDDAESTKTARSKAVTDHYKSWLWSDFYGQLEANDPLFLVGSNLGKTTMLGEVFSDPLTGLPKPSFTCIKIRSCDKEKRVENGKTIFVLSRPVWRQKHTVEALHTKLLDMGEYRFDAEYQGEPHSEDEPIFPSDIIRANYVLASDVPPEKECDVFMAFDPAYGVKQIHDYSGWVLGYVHAKGDGDFTIYIANGAHARMNNADKVRWILDQTVLRPEMIFFLETEGDKKSLHTSIDFQAAAEHIYPTIIPVETGGKDKRTRGESVQPVVFAGRVKFIKDKYPAFIDELTTFTGTEQDDHDDMVDALIYLLKQIQVWYAGQKKKPKMMDSTEPPTTEELTKRRTVVRDFKERQIEEKEQGDEYTSLVRFGG